MARFKDEFDDVERNEPETDEFEFEPVGPAEETEEEEIGRILGRERTDRSERRPARRDPDEDEDEDDEEDPDEDSEEDDEPSREDPRVRQALQAMAVQQAQATQNALFARAQAFGNAVAQYDDQIARLEGLAAQLQRDPNRYGDFMNAQNLIRQKSGERDQARAEGVKAYTDAQNVQVQQIPEVRGPTEADKFIARNKKALRFTRTAEGEFVPENNVARAALRLSKKYVGDYGNTKALWRRVERELAKKYPEKFEGRESRDERSRDPGPGRTAVRSYTRQAPRSAVARSGEGGGGRSSAGNPTKLAIPKELLRNAERSGRYDLSTPEGRNALARSYKATLKNMKD